MICPDETTIAAFMQAGLSQQRAAEVEQHIDQCGECAALLASLGRVYGPNSGSAEAPSSPPVVPNVSAAVRAQPYGESAARRHTESRGALILRRHLLLQAAMSLVHAWGCVLVMPALLDACSSDVQVQSALLSAPPAMQMPIGSYDDASVSAWAIAYLIVWLHLGIAWTIANVYGLFRRRTWARSLTLGYALLSLPTGLGTLASAYVLWSLTRPGTAGLLGSKGACHARGVSRTPRA